MKTQFMNVIFTKIFLLKIDFKKPKLQVGKKALNLLRATASILCTFVVKGRDGLKMILKWQRCFP